MDSVLVSNSYFEVNFLITLGSVSGNFTKVSGLGIQLDYEQYYEGGSLYPRFLYNYAKPQTLVLERGLITSPADVFYYWAVSLNQGMMIPAATGVIKLKDNAGKVHRVWTIAGAYLTKYEGPALDSNTPQLAVSRIEMVYGGVF